MHRSERFVNIIIQISGAERVDILSETLFGQKHTYHSLSPPQEKVYVSIITGII